MIIKDKISHVRVPLNLPFFENRLKLLENALLYSSADPKTYKAISRDRLKTALCSTLMGRDKKGE